MAEIDPEIERRLHRLYQHIEAAPVPRRLDHIDTHAAGRSRRVVAFTATAALAAVLSVALVVIGLSNHRANSPTPSAPAASAPPSTANPSGRPTVAPSTVPSPSAVAPPGPDPALGGPVPSGFASASVTFVSPRVGWVLGTAPCAAANPCLTLLRTQDGGATWVRVAAPPTAFSPGPRGNSGVQSVRFADGRNGWVFSPELWASHDGGAHWTRVSLPGVNGSSPVTRLETSAGTVHAAVFDVDGAGAPAVVIETAAVGGDRWQRSPTTVMIGAGPVPQVELVLHGGEGWIIVNDRGVVGGARYHNSRWTTWQPPCTSTSGSGGGDGALAASTATDLIAVCIEGAWSSVRPLGVHAYTSQDGGTTFQRAAGSLPMEAGGAVASGRPQQAVVAASSNGSAELLLTTDGGASTTVVYRAGGSGVAADLGFTTADQGVVVEAAQGGGSTGALLMTHDGGRHWAPVTFATAPR